MWFICKSEELGDNLIVINFFIFLLWEIIAILINIENGFLATIVLADNFRSITEESFLCCFIVAVICFSIALSAVRGEGAVIGDLLVHVELSLQWFQFVMVTVEIQILTQITRALVLNRGKILKLLAGRNNKALRDWGWWCES